MPLDDPVRRAAEGDTLFVAETAAMEIRAYGPDGHLVRRFGGRGDGPGELQAITYWGVQGDTVWVMGGSLPGRRITLFRRDGSLIGTVTAGLEIREGAVTARVLPWALLPDGRFAGSLTSWTLPQTGPTVTLQVPLVNFDATGAPTDTVGYRELTVTPSATRPHELVGNVRIFPTTVPSSFRLFHLVGEDSVLVHRPVAEGPDRGEVTVLRVTASADTLFRRDFTYTPERIDAAFADSVIEARMDPYRNVTNDLAALTRAVRAATEIATFHPPVTQLVAMGDGTLWMRRSVADPDGWRWIVLAPDGTLRGEVLTRPGTAPLWGRGDMVYLSEPDDFEVPWIVRYRLGG